MRTPLDYNTSEERREEIRQSLITAAGSGDLDAVVRLFGDWKVSQILDLHLVNRLLERWQCVQDGKPQSRFFQKELHGPLHEVRRRAFENGHLHVLRYLFEQGFVVEWSEAAHAITHQQYDMLELFLKHGWNMDRPKRVSTQLPALSLAVRNNDVRMVRWLLAKGAELERPFNPALPFTALSLAVKHASFEIVRILVDYGARVDYGDPLHYISQRTQEDALDVLLYLLENGAPIDKLEKEELPIAAKIKDRQPHGRGTPLHEAVRYRRGDIIQALLEYGADKTIKNTKGESPEEMARITGAYEVLDYLL